MRVMVYKRTEKGRDIVVVPGKKAVLPPLVLRDASRQYLRDELPAILEGLKKREPGSREE